MKYVSDSFLAFFDRLDNNCRKGSTWKVRECDRGATLTELEVNNHDAEFYGFDQSITKSMKALTEDRSGTFKDKECDGVAFFRGGSEERLLFVELKSKYDTTKVADAIRQMCFSFLKMHAMLSLCDGYLSEKLPVDFCAATKHPDENEKDKLRHWLYQSGNLDEKNDRAKFFQTLFDKGCADLNFEQLFQIMNINLPLHQDIKAKQIKVILHTSQTPSAANALLNYPH